jgi:hypothetical protein
MGRDGQRRRQVPTTTTPAAAGIQCRLFASSNQRSETRVLSFRLLSPSMVSSAKPALPGGLGVVAA